MLATPRLLPRHDPERAASRRQLTRTAPADRRRAAEHVASAVRVSVPATVSLRGRSVAPAGDAAGGDRARSQGGVLQPGAGRRVVTHAGGRDGMTGNGAGPPVELENRKDHFPINGGLLLD